MDSIENESPKTQEEQQQPPSAPPQQKYEASDVVGVGPGKIFISYILLGVFFTSFVLVTVALGLLVSLVNNPACNETEAILETETKMIASILDKEKAIRASQYKRELLASKSKLGILRDFESGRQLFNDYPLCPELLDSPVGQPWEKKRLPSNIEPVNYNIMLRAPIFATTFYNGEMTIDVSVRQQTQYIVLHSKFLSDYLPSVKDAAGFDVPIACVGDFLPNDYYVIKTVQLLSVARYTIDLFFSGSMLAFSNGIFDIKYNSTDNEFQGNMLATHFEPVDARLGFPCFDEPEYKALFNIRIYHPNGTTALSNMPTLDEVPEDGELLTRFEESPRLPVYLVAMLIFNKTDFNYKEVITNLDVPIRVWARTQYVEGLNSSIDGPVKMIANIFNNFDFLYNQVGEAIPPKIDVFAIPYYPQDSVGHLGLFVVRETKLLFRENNVQERVKQAIALDMAKLLATMWFGNYVTFKWWNELWLQESISDYVKYRAVDRTYPDWRVQQQFITEELIYVLLEDSYPSTHPVIKDVSSPEEIFQLFDMVEISKGAAILRMIEYELGPNDVYLGLINYLKRSAASGLGDALAFWTFLDPIRQWQPYDFADRWLRQAGYPMIRVRIENRTGVYFFTAAQERFKSDYSIFAGQELYPSPYDNQWYIPLTCMFGISPNESEPLEAQFSIDTKTFEAVIGDGSQPYTWVHCDVVFAGYYLIDYSVENWDRLGEVLGANNPNLIPQDRANIIHNLFMNTFTGKTSYIQLAKELTYLKTETDYLPWKTAIKHVYDLADILQYRRSFLQLSAYFLTELSGIEYSTDLWTPSGDHLEEMKREVILDFACRMQDTECLNNATSLWQETFPTLDLTLANNLDPHVRAVVYNYHMQNTYDTSEWRFIVDQYSTIWDIQDRELLVEAITYSRLPWVLLRFLDDVATNNRTFEKLEFFVSLSLLAKNPLGREIAWNYYRANFGQILIDFGYEEPEIGATLVNIVRTFADDLYYFELLDFIEQTNHEASCDARRKAVDIVSSNTLWLQSKEDEIIEAFGGIRRQTSFKDDTKSLADITKLKRKMRDAFDAKFECPLVTKKNKKN